MSSKLKFRFLLTVVLSLLAALVLCACVNPSGGGNNQGNMAGESDGELNNGTDNNQGQITEDDDESDGADSGNDDSTGVTEGENGGSADSGDNGGNSAEHVCSLDNVEIIPGKEPTCTEKGLTEGKKCAVCGEVIVAQQELQPSHSLNQYRECTVCDFAYSSAGLEYMYIELSDYGKSYIVVGYNDIGEEEVVIPSLYNGLPVGIIDEAVFSGCNSIKSLVIGKNVHTIQPSAFSNCYSLENVIIGENVKTIKEGAFQGCVKLKSVEVPDSVEVFGPAMFRGCSGLESVTVGNGVTVIGQFTFGECISLKNAVLGDNLTKISYDAFFECRNLSSIVIPDKVEKIETGAFSGCFGLVSITIGESVKKIEGFAFRDCYKLVEVINRSSLNLKCGSEQYGFLAFYAKEIHSEQSKVVRYDDYLFYTCDGTDYLIGYVGNDEMLVLPEKYGNKSYKIYKYAFYENTDIISVVIQNGVKDIGESAFRGCLKLVEVINRSYLSLTAGKHANGSVAAYAIEVHSGESSRVVNYNDYLFYSCSGVNYLFGYSGGEKSLILPESYNGEKYAIYNYAFYEKNSKYSNTFYDDVQDIVSVVIPEGVNAIGECAFEGCDSLESIVLPCDITAIGYGTFKGCEKLNGIVIPATVKYVGIGAFYNCYALTDVYYCASESEWSKIVIEINNEKLTDANIHFDFAE